jgi:FixJ family two-component response regulator
VAKSNIKKRQLKGAERLSHLSGQKASSQARPDLSKTFPGYELLTPRERVVLAQIVRGASSKEVGKALGVSSRTIEFHRANIMKKLGTRKIVDLLTLVLGNDEGR